ncbi:hypothetical protein [Yoonia sp.]|uniref:hypothetical protein n=1 Tax=Yoonia sp. TaxID=2212373 RepID=UPI0035C7DEE0
MDWLIENWVLVLLFGGMAAMHLFGHGHGGHKHDKSGTPQEVDKKTADATSDNDAAPKEDA